MQVLLSMPLPLIPMIQIFYSRDCSQKGLAALFYILILKWPHYRSLLPHEPLATKIFLTCKVWVELNPLTAHTVLSPQWVCMKLDKRRDGKDLEAMSAQVMTVSIFLFFFFLWTCSHTSLMMTIIALGHGGIYSLTEDIHVTQSTR